MEAQRGDRARVHYTGRLDDGSVFDSLDANHPLAGENLTFDLELVGIA